MRVLCRLDGKYDIQRLANDSLWIIIPERPPLMTPGQVNIFITANFCHKILIRNMRFAGAQKGMKGVYGVPRAYERSFRWKLSQFRYLCQSNALPSHIKITVTRQTLFEDSYHQIMRLPAYELRRRLYIIFVSIAIQFESRKAKKL